MTLNDATDAASMAIATQRNQASRKAAVAATAADRLGQNAAREIAMGDKIGVVRSDGDIAATSAAATIAADREDEANGTAAIAATSADRLGENCVRGNAASDDAILHDVSVVIDDYRLAIARSSATTTDAHRAAAEASVAAATTDRIAQKCRPLS